MKFYRLYDRFLGHWMTPFQSPDEQAVLAALSASVNNGDPSNAIAQAPHHYELYEVAKEDEDHNIVGGYRQFIADLASLSRGVVRRDIRQDPNAEPSTGQMAPTLKPSHRPIDKPLQNSGANEPTPAVPAPPKDFTLKAGNQRLG